LGKKGPKIRKWRNLGVDVIQPGSRSVSGDSWGWAACHRLQIQFGCWWLGLHVPVVREKISIGCGCIIY